VKESPLIITVAPNGARKNKNDHAALPITPDEIAIEAKACLNAGAAMLHLHVRDENDAHTLDVDAYRKAIDAVRNAVGDEMIIQVTSEAVGIYTPDQQIEMMHQLRPEAASVALKELTADGEEKAATFYHWADDNNIALQHILYTPDEVVRLAYMTHNNMVPHKNLSVLYVLGRYGDGVSKPDDLPPFIDAAQKSGLKPKLWSVCAFGPNEHEIMLEAMKLGGHVRVGFENNLYLNNNTLSPDNASLVSQVADSASLLYRSVYRGEQARTIMGVESKAN